MAWLCTSGFLFVRFAHGRISSLRSCLPVKRKRPSASVFVGKALNLQFFRGRLLTCIFKLAVGRTQGVPRCTAAVSGAQWSDIAVTEPRAAPLEGLVSGPILFHLACGREEGFYRCMCWGGAAQECCGKLCCSWHCSFGSCVARCSGTSSPSAPS